MEIYFSTKFPLLLLLISQWWMLALCTSVDPYDPNSVCGDHEGEYIREDSYGVVCCGNQTLKLPDVLLENEDIIHNCSAKFADDKTSDLPTGMWKSLICTLKKLKVIKSEKKLTFNEILSFRTKRYPKKIKAKLKKEVGKCSKIDKEKMDPHSKLEKYMECFFNAEHKVCHKPYGDHHETYEEEEKQRKQLGCPIVHGLSYGSSVQHCCKKRSTPYPILDFPAGKHERYSLDNHNDHDDGHDNDDHDDKEDDDHNESQDDNDNKSDHESETAHEDEDHKEDDEHAEEEEEKAVHECSTSFNERMEELKGSESTTTTTQKAKSTDEDHEDDHEHDEMLSTLDTLCEEACHVEPKNYTKDRLKLDFESVAEFYMKSFGNKMKSDMLKILQRRKNEKIFLSMEVETEKSQPMDFKELAKKFNKATEMEKINYYCKFVNIIYFEEKRAMHEYCFDETMANTWGKAHPPIFIEPEHEDDHDSENQDHDHDQH